MPGIDQYSIATVPIECFFNSTNLWLGTAFVWEHAGSFFLITNWHNFSGKDVFTKKHTSNTAAEPNTVRVWWNQKGQLGNKFSNVEPIRDQTGAPLWLVHPQHGNDIDVVALPVTPHANAEMHPINKMDRLELILQVGMDVYALGYPYGMGPGGLPVWKRGSIASEPEVFPPSQLFFLIDTASRPGMSGSPVIRRSWGNHQLKDGSVALGPGSATEFVGVYSGRITAKDPLDAQLGIAWPARYVTEIISGMKRDNP
jgi:hypothetical protein